MSVSEIRLRTVCQAVLISSDSSRVTVRLWVVFKNQFIFGNSSRDESGGYPRFAYTGFHFSNFALHCVICWSRKFRFNWPNRIDFCQDHLSPCQFGAERRFERSHLERRSPRSHTSLFFNEKFQFKWTSTQNKRKNSLITTSRFVFRYQNKDRRPPSVCQKLSPPPPSKQATSRKRVICFA